VVVAAGQGRDLVVNFGNRWLAGVVPEAAGIVDGDDE